ncbi:ParM/StbA family protein [Geopseudomonas aromaticivorans]
MKDKSILNIGLDVGCNWTKGYLGDGNYLALRTSVSNQPRRSASLGLAGEVSELVLKIGDATYAVGPNVQDAMDTRYEGYYESDHNLAAALAQLLSMQPDLRHTVVNAVFGMPLSVFYKTDGTPNVELINARAKAWNKPARVLSGPAGMHLPDESVFGDLEGVAEGVGAYLDYHLDEEGNVAHDFGGLRCVVDLGGHTVDLGVFEDGQVLFNGDTTSHTHLGALKLYENVAARTMDLMGLRKVPPLAAIERAVREDGCKFRSGAQTANLRDIVAEERRALVNGLIPAIKKSLTRRLDEVDTVIYAGGGAQLLERELMESTIGNARVVILPEPQFANARGYYKYLRNRQSQEA